MATVPNTATLPHQQLQNMIWENCPRVQIFCFLCSQMVSSVFAFMELQKCPLWHGATAGPSKQGWEHPLSSYRIQETAFGEPFCAHPMEARGPLPHFQSAFVLLQSNSPGQSLAMTPHTAPAWFKWRNYFFLSTNLAITLKELHCTISARAAQHFCFVLRAQLQACADIYQRRFRPASTWLMPWKKELYYHSPDTPGVTTVAKESTQHLQWG